jgi:hypothetical protein
MTRRTRHRGYVLLLTLLLLAIAAAALAGVCRLGLEKSVRAARAQEDLQRRWGTLSLRTALLAKAPLVFASPGPARGAESRMRIGLGGQPVELVFGDEQAKANVNMLQARDGPASADRVVRQLAQAAGAAALRVELRPVAPEPSDVDAADEKAPDPDPNALPDFTVEPVFESWSQVFRRAGPDDLIGRRGPLPSIAANLTCWGDGMVNVRRASPEAIRAACGKWLRPAEIAKLVAAREKDPDFDVWETLDALNLSEARREAADRLLTEESTCYSLWIVTRAGGREWYDLAVADVTAAGVSDIQVFSW